MGKKFGIMTIEDYSGKSEFMMWSEDYAKYHHYLTPGNIVTVEGSMRQRFNGGQVSFSISKLHLLETVKTSMTRQLILDVPPEHVDEQFVNFIENNINKHPGNTSIKFQIADREQQLKFSLYSLAKGFSMNDEMANYLTENQHIGVSVVTN
jgi:DNA polymerase-3 subunit alpha